MSIESHRWELLAARWRYTFSFYTSTDEITRALNDLAIELHAAGVDDVEFAAAVFHLWTGLERDAREQTRPTRRHVADVEGRAQL